MIAPPTPRSLLALLVTLITAGVGARAAAAQDFEAGIRPMLAEFCQKCHSTEKQKGDLDLERFTSFDAVRKDAAVWQLVDEQLALGEMPPKDKPQPSPEQKARLVAWVQATLDALARERAGDPGPVVLRRLSNAEYTHTIRDLTGVAALEPAREFPLDGAAGEGFTNTGAALVMSPGLLTKYLDAAKDIAEHGVLLPDGIAFSPHTSQRDWTEEKLAAIRAFYARHTDSGGGQAVNLQGIKFDTNAGGRLPVERYITALVEEHEALESGTHSPAAVARDRGLNAKYMATLWRELSAEDASVILAPLRAKWRAGDTAAVAAMVADWQKALWRFTTVGHIGKAKGPKSWLEAVTPAEFAVDGVKPDAADVDRFRALFPAALCYTKIVPVDEVVTLTLFHREDDQLRRLMLDDAQTAELERLWSELHFIGHDALKLVDAFEQLWQFATQDGDPKVFEPMREPIKKRAAEFRAQLVAAEPRQLDGVLDFAQRAWRRPLTDAERGELRALYRKLRDLELPHDAALRMTLARIFVAPAFLYKMERPAPGVAQAPVSDWELATRLSYFLWSSAPDAELRALAAAGTLREPATLAAQTRRMLRDARVRRLAVEFGCQWLHVRDFEKLDEKSERHFPTFAALRGAMAEEPARFFTDFFQRDASVLSLLDADHTFVNSALAKHYGLTVKGDDWQRVEGVRAQGRGGILAFAATLAKQSGASRTSPILRGNWLCETLLGERLPRPPKGVPVLPEEVPQGLTDRQLTEQHSSDPKCAGCHVRIDPFGFAFERYDAIGGLRASADTRARLADGTEFGGLDGVREYLLTKRRDAFVKQFTRKLLGYALGRGVQLSDKPLIEAITTQVSTNDPRIGRVIEMIVLSRQFREIRGVDLTAGN